MELVGGRRWTQPEHVEAVGTAEHRVGAGETGHRKRASRAAEPEPGVVLNPTKRSRTQLTEAKVDAIRNARTNGESVTSTCRRFDVHRMDRVDAYQGSAVTAQ